MHQTAFETILEARLLRRRLEHLREEFLKQQEIARRQREVMARERDERRRLSAAVPTSPPWF
jgi:hypothetical protein